MAYVLAKRANRAAGTAAAIAWGQRGARINCLNPGIIATPLARDEMSGPQHRRLPGHDRHLGRRSGGQPRRCRRPRRIPAQRGGLARAVSGCSWWKVLVLVMSQALRLIE